MVRVAVRSATN